MYAKKKAITVRKAIHYATVNMTKLVFLVRKLVGLVCIAQDELLELII